MVLMFYMGIKKKCQGIYIRNESIKKKKKKKHLLMDIKKI